MSRRCVSASAKGLRPRSSAEEDSRRFAQSLAQGGARAVQSRANAALGGVQSIGERLQRRAFDVVLEHDDAPRLGQCGDRFFEHAAPTLLFDAMVGALGPLAA